jgi:zinc transporter ZupT
MGIALFHLLPEGIENIEKYFKDKPDSFWNKIPLAFFLTFASYSLILFVEKIAFDSHSLIEHDHGEEGHAHDHAHNEELKSHKSEKKALGEKLISKDGSESEDSDEEEEALKNVVSSRGKFASFMQMRNSMVENQRRSFKGEPPVKKDRALARASMILQRTLNQHAADENEDMQYMVNPQNVHVDDKGKDHAHHEEFKPKSNITPYLLLLALSLHGFFEGIALGIQGAVKDTLFLFIAIISHKWAEAFTLVNI